MAGFLGPAEEMFSGRSGSISMDGSREYTKKYLVRVTDNTLSSVAVCNAPGLPIPFAPYQSGNGTEYDLLALAVKFSAEQQSADDWSVWVVTVSYSTQMPEGGSPEDFGYPTPPGGGGGGGKGSSNNPDLEPPDIEWDFEVENKPWTQDLEEREILNYADVPFSPAPNFPTAHPVLVLTRNETSFDYKKAEKYAFAVNIDMFLGAPPGHCLCMPPKAKKMFRGPLTYWRLTYRIKFLSSFVSYRQIDWQPQVLNAGVLERERDHNSPNFDKPVPILRNLSPISQPVLLDNNGYEATQKDPKTGRILPIFIRFKVYREESFRDLITRGL